MDHFNRGIFLKNISNLGVLAGALLPSTSSFAAAGDDSGAGECAQSILLQAAPAASRFKTLI